jgi:hypothetical protein
MVLPNGVVWQQHLLVLMVSAKLLADAEAAMQTHGDAAGSKQQRLGAGVFVWLCGCMLEQRVLFTVISRAGGQGGRICLCRSLGTGLSTGLDDGVQVLLLRGCWVLMPAKSTIMCRLRPISRAYVGPIPYDILITAVSIDPARSAHCP